MKDGGNGEIGRNTKEGRWLTALGSWFRKQRPDSGLWNDVSVNHDWSMFKDMPSVEAPAMFIIARMVHNPRGLLLEAIRRLKSYLPNSDRIPAAVVPLMDDDYAIMLRLEDFVDILTDAVLCDLSSLNVGEFISELKEWMNSTSLDHTDSYSYVLDASPADDQFENTDTSDS